MHLDGVRLIAVLERQQTPVQIFGPDGLPQQTVPSQQAAELARTGHYVGCGAANRMKYLRLRDVPVGYGAWTGRTNTRIMRNDHGAVIPACLGSNVEHRPLMKFR